VNIGIALLRHITLMGYATLAQSSVKMKLGMFADPVEGDLWSLQHSLYHTRNSFCSDAV